MIKTNYPIEVMDLSKLPTKLELTDTIHKKLMELLKDSFGSDDEFTLKYGYTFYTIIRDQIDCAMIGLGMDDAAVKGTPEEARFYMTDYANKLNPNDISSRECLIAVDFSNGVVFDIHVALRYQYNGQVMIEFSRSIPRKETETCFVFNSFNKTERALCDLTCDSIETEAWAHVLEKSFDSGLQLYIGYKITFNDCSRHFYHKDIERIGVVDDNT